MKLQLFALTLGLAFGALPAAAIEPRTQHAQRLHDHILDTVKNGDLAKLATYVTIRKITNFNLITDSIHGMNPLHWAAIHGHTDIIRYLILRGADVNTTTSKGFTPLHLATFAGHSQAAKALVSEGNCDLGKRTISGLTPLDLARGKQNQDLEDFFIKASKNPKRARFAVNLPGYLAVLAQ